MIISRRAESKRTARFAPSSMVCILDLILQLSTAEKLDRDVYMPGSEKLSAILSQAII